MKKVLLLLVSLLAAVALFACDNIVIPRGERLVEWIEIDADTQLDTGRQVTINHWHRMGAANQPMLDRWIEMFQEQHPTITVNAVWQDGGYDGLRNAIAEEIRLGNNADMPDVMESYPDHILSYIPPGALNPRPMALNNFITHPTLGLSVEEWLDILEAFRIESQYDESAREGTADWNAEFRIGGSIMSLPYLKSTEVLVYDSALFDRFGWEVPTTWEELSSLATTIRTVITDERFQILGYDSPGNFFITGSKQYGAPYTSINDELIGSVDFNNPQSISMMTFFKGLFNERALTTRDAMNVPFLSAVFVNTPEGGVLHSNGNRYNHGGIAMYIGSSAGVRNSLNANAWANGIRPSVAPIPHFEGREALQIQQGPNISAFYNNDEQRAIASWLWLRFLTSPEINAEFITNTGHTNPAIGAPGNMPSRVSTLQTETWLNFKNSVVQDPQTFAEAQRAIAYQTVNLSLELMGRYFTTESFDRSSRTRQAVGALLDAIMALDANLSEQELQNRITALFQQQYDFVMAV